MGIRSLFHTLFIAGKWSVIVAHSPDDLDENRVMRIKASPFEWYADPFVLTVNDALFVFCERKKFSKKNGDICCFLWKNNRFHKKLLLREPFHLSFPNVFQYRNVYYLIPESSRGLCLRLYRFFPEQEKCQLEKTLLDACSYVDSVILPNQDSLGLYCYDGERGLIEYHLNDDFSLTEVACYRDSNSRLRPAGNPRQDIFYFQDCSREYGEKVLAKQKVDGEFRDVSDSYLQAISAYCKRHRYSRFHTLNFDGDGKTFVFDVYRERFSFVKPFLLFWRFICGNR